MGDSATSTSQQLKHSMPAMTVDCQVLQHEMKECFNEGFIDIQINQLKVQATDFVEAITRERETRPANTARHRSEISRIAGEWQTLARKFATSSPPVSFEMLQGHSSVSPCDKAGM